MDPICPIAKKANMISWGWDAVSISNVPYRFCVRKTLSVHKLRWDSTHFMVTRQKYASTRSYIMSTLDVWQIFYVLNEAWQEYSQDIPLKQYTIYNIGVPATTCCFTSRNDLLIFFRTNYIKKSCNLTVTPTQILYILICKNLMTFPTSQMTT